MFGNLETVTELAVASIQVENQAKADADAAEDKSRLPTIRQSLPRLKLPNQSLTLML